MADTNFTDATTSVNGTPIVSSWLDDVNTNTYTILATVAGTNAITGAGASTITVAYPRGVAIRFLPVANNTGPVTLNISGLGVRNVTKFGTDPLVANDLRIGMWAYVAYDGVQFQLINPRTTDFLFPSGTLPASSISGILAIANGGTGVATINPVGNCRLVKSGANLVLQPYQGNKLAFNTGYATIPAAGVSLAPGALAINTNFNIYAVQTAGVVTSLEANAAAHVTDTTTGIETLTGDPTRVLVGKARTIAGPAWQDTAAQRFVISWFNRRSIPTLAFFTANRTGNSVSYLEVNAEIRNEFLTWGDTSVSLNVNGTTFNSVAAAATQVTIGLDSTTVAQDANQQSGNPAGITSLPIPVGLSLEITPTEGNHFATLLALVAGGGGPVATFTGSGTVGVRTAMNGTIQG